TDGQSHRYERLARKALAKQPIDGPADERQQRDEPKIKIGILPHNLSRLTWSMFKVSRVRNSAMMIARPTAASAAATTITKNTNTCPLSCCHRAAKATKERFTPLSMSSIDINMVMILRLIKNPMTPQANKIPLSTR